MKKTIVYLLLLLAVSSIVLTAAPSVYGETENAKILNYSYHINSKGILTVDGEVQNIGSSIISQVIVSGTVTPSYGDAVVSGDLVWARNMLPGQKAPFQMEFRTNLTETGAWVGGISDVSVKVIQAPTTIEYQYQDVTITSHQGSSTSTGGYVVAGELKNTGTQDATNVAVVATFYNSEGVPVTVGFTDPIAAMSPGGINTFQVSALDLNQTTATQDKKIASYKLLVQVESPLLTGDAPSPTADTTGSSSGTTSNANNLTPATIAALVVVVVVVLVVVILLMKRKPVEIKSSKPAKHGEQSQGRKRRKR